MRVAATGHRPDKLGGYDETTRRVVTGFAREFLVLVSPTHVISGMALGWDQAVAQAAIDVGIPFSAAVPFLGQQNRWRRAQQHAYERLIHQAARVTIVCENWEVEDGGVAWALRERNRWMVDNADHIFALWDGSPGGTAHCIEYARGQKVPVSNGWPGFSHYRNSGKWLI